MRCGVSPCLLIQGYIGIMETKMETTIWGLGFGFTWTVSGAYSKQVKNP